MARKKKTIWPAKVRLDERTVIKLDKAVDFLWWKGRYKNAVVLSEPRR
jgi:hypothetical protein